MSFNLKVEGIICSVIFTEINITDWNRDKNAVQNMLKIVKSIFNTGKRP